MIKSEKFNSAWELVRFLNLKKIKKEQIIQITHAAYFAWHTFHDDYTVFWEVEHETD